MNYAASAPLHHATFTDQLKQETRDLHDQLESTPLSMAIVSPEVNEKEYCRYLEVMHSVHESIEKQVFPILEGIVPDLNDRRKAQLTALDLEAMGHEIKDDTVVKMDSSLQKISIPQALGILYVIEGSSLGARYILKNISRLANSHTYTQYLRGYGEQTGTRWKTLVELINQYESAKACGKSIAEGARLLYQHLIGIFAAGQVA